MTDVMGRLDRRRNLLRVVIGLLVGWAVLGAGAVVLCAMRGRSIRYVLLTVLLGTGLSLTALAALPVWRRSYGRLVLGLSVLVSATSFVAGMIWVWRPGGPRAHGVETVALLVGMTCSALVAFLCLTALARLRSSWEWTRRATRMSAVLLAACIAWIVLFDVRESVGAPTLTILILLTVCGTIGFVFLHWLGKSLPADAVTTPLVVSLVCPRCGEMQEMLAGGARCRRCHLLLRIEIEEELCPACGYLLDRLTSARCPECGALVVGAAKGVSPSEAPAGQRGD